MPPNRRHAAVLSLLVMACCAPTTSSAADAIPDATARDDLRRIIETRGYTRGLPRKPLPSPDGRSVYFLRSGPRDGVQQLFRHDLETQATHLFLDGARLSAAGTISAGEQTRRERARETEAGLTDYTLSRDGRHVLVAYAGDLFLLRASDGGVERLTTTPAAEIDAHLAPDGAHVAFLRGDALCILDCSSRAIVELVPETAGLGYGAAEFVAQEEMGRRTGHWWSPDSRWLALTEVDTRGVPQFQVPHLADALGAGSTSPYPRAGDPNARVRLGVVGRSGGAIRWLDLGADSEYLARVDWAPASDALWVQTQPRDQKRLDLQRIDLASGTRTLVRRETDPDWVNLHDNFRCLDDGRHFLWSSERSGVRNLEIVRLDGGTARVLTPDSLNVASVAHVDEQTGTVAFSAFGADVRQLHVFCVALGGGPVQLLSTRAGWHEAAFHDQVHDLWIDGWSDSEMPARFRVCDRDGSERGELPSVALAPQPRDSRPHAQFLRLVTATGVAIDARVLQPVGAAPRSLPLVVTVYGGPHGQQVRRRWGGERELFDTWLAERGFVVARLDGRGAWGRGHASERIYSRRMGAHEIDDQAAGVRALVARVDAIDSTRVGIWGWSYGGYATLMALMRHADIFRAGVAVAPVVDWRGYDTHYTERYLGLPQENPAGYDSSSVLTWVPRLRGHLTVVHGASDDNVHMRESMLLMQRLVELGKPVDLMIYPGTHMLQTSEERMHLFERVWRTFATHL